MKKSTLKIDVRLTENEANYYEDCIAILSHRFRMRYAKYNGEKYNTVIVVQDAIDTGFVDVCSIVRNDNLSLFEFVNAAVKYEIEFNNYCDTLTNEEKLSEDNFVIATKNGLYSWTAIKKLVENKVMNNHSFKKFMEGYYKFVFRFDSWKCLPNKTFEAEVTLFDGTFSVLIFESTDYEGFKTYKFVSDLGNAKVENCCTAWGALVEYLHDYILEAKYPGITKVDYLEESNDLPFEICEESDGKELLALLVKENRTFYITDEALECLMQNKFFSSLPF